MGRLARAAQPRARPGRRMAASGRATPRAGAARVVKPSGRLERVSLDGGAPEAPDRLVERGLFEQAEAADRSWKATGPSRNWVEPTWRCNAAPEKPSPT